MISLVRGMYSRWRLLVHEMAKFGVVGVLNTVLDWTLFDYLHFGHPQLGSLTAKTISTVVATTSSYFMNRHWSFRHRARSGLAREYSLFFVLNGIGLGIQLAVLAVVQYGLGMTSFLALNAALIFGTGLGMIFRFVTYKRWVFLEPAQGVAVEPGPAAVAAGTRVRTMGADGAATNGHGSGPARTGPPIAADEPRVDADGNGRPPGRPAAAPPGRAQHNGHRPADATGQPAAGSDARAPDVPLPRH